MMRQHRRLSTPGLSIELRQLAGGALSETKDTKRASATIRARQAHRRGFGLVGLLVTMACMVVLFAVLMSSMNTAVTGAGNTLPGSVSSIKDEMQLAELYKALLADGLAGGGFGDGAGARGSSTGFPVPSDLDRSGDRSRDTTAALWSAIVMANAASPGMLVSANERNPMIEPMEGYDYNLYDPASGVCWDPRFKADLSTGSNASYGHMPLCGARAQRHWRTPSLDPRFPIIGSRGPRDGKIVPDSWTIGRNGGWAGHVVFGDGHVEWLDSTNAPGLRRGEGATARPDSLFAMEDGADGGDAVIVFTRLMKASGPELQWD